MDIIGFDLGKLLNDPKPNGDRYSFQYYRKTIVVPVVGDILRIEYTNFSTYYILVTNVVFGEGKDGIMYMGNVLKQKEMDGYGYSPSLLRSRTDFEITNRQVTINPKDKNKITNTLIEELSI